jgi:hypothetical protein|tara:strand:+ start:344 stop:556 length:213 start_codon:yes stop_codon:yes gene_type:complete
MTDLLEDFEDLERILDANSNDTIGPEKEAQLNKKQRGIIALEARRRVALKLEEAQIRKEMGNYNLDYDLD